MAEALTLIAVIAFGMLALAVTGHVLAVRSIMRPVTLLAWSPVRRTADRCQDLARGGTGGSPAPPAARARS